MSADVIKVTVDGEPITAEVSWEQVRAYLRAKGWLPLNDGRPVDWWALPACPHRILVGSEPEESAQIVLLYMETGLHVLALHEQRHMSAVLHDIARGAEPPASVEPLSEAELAALDRTDEEWRRTASGFDALTVRRLLATVSAQEAEIERLRHDLTEAEGLALRLRECLD